MSNFEREKWGGGGLRQQDLIVCSYHCSLSRTISLYDFRVINKAFLSVERKFPSSKMGVVQRAWCERSSKRHDPAEVPKSVVAGTAFANRSENPRRELASLFQK